MDPRLTLTADQAPAWLVQFKYTVRQKSNPLRFFAVFSATVWNFNSKFYNFIQYNLLHLTAK